MPIQFSELGHGLFIKFEVQGETQVAMMLTGVAGKVKDFRPLAPKVDDIMRKDVEDTFEREGEGRLKWADLAPSTIASRIRRGFPGAHPILVNTGWLKGAFIERYHPAHIIDAHLQYIDFGARVSYAPYHQDPSRSQYVESGLPRRAMIYIITRTVSNLIQAFRQYILKEGRR